MDLTWSLYEAGYKTTFCHHALAYTYDPETFAVYTKQMRRWASGFFQNFQSHKRQVVKSPSALLVVGSMLFDLLSMPFTYVFAVVWAVRDPEKLKWMVPAFLISLALHGTISILIVTRTISWKQALVGFPCYWAANWWNKTIYLWTFTREWILGRHYMSWTGRQGRATEIAPMSPARKLILLTLATAAAGWFAVENQPMRAPLYACVLLGMISLMLVARSWPDEQAEPSDDHGHERPTPVPLSAAEPTSPRPATPQTPLTQVRHAQGDHAEMPSTGALVTRPVESLQLTWLACFEERLQTYEERQEQRLQRLHGLIVTQNLALATPSAYVSSED
jgi:hypothetical protein